MSGKNVSVCGARRGYLLTDEIAVREVGRTVDAAKTHSGCAGNERNVDSANRFPYSIRANAAGRPYTLVLTKINNVPQSVLVTRAPPGGKRRMTCVPLRFDEYLYDAGVVATCALVESPATLVMEDVVMMGGGSTEHATASERANIAYELVHERFRADPVLQPFKVECARHFGTVSEARDAVKGYGYPVGSYTLCPQNLGQRDVWLRSGGPKIAGPPRVRLPSGDSVLVVFSDMPDVFMVSGSEDAGPLIIRTLEDSEYMRKLAADSKGRAFRVPAKWDAVSKRWTFVPRSRE